MLFNYDSMAQWPFVVTGIIVGGLFSYTFYNIFTTNAPAPTYTNVGTQIDAPTYANVGTQTESLVNTIPNLNTIQELSDSTVFGPTLQPTILHKLDIGVQTESHSYADAGILHKNIEYVVDTGVQTPITSLWNMFKEWLNSNYSIISGSINQTPTEVRVENWIDNLASPSSQVVSTNSMNSVVSRVNSQELVDVGESVSNVGGEPVSNLDELVSVYDINSYYS